MCLFLDILNKIYRLMLLAISSISVNKDFFEKFENFQFWYFNLKNRRFFHIDPKIYMIIKQRYFKM